MRGEFVRRTKQAEQSAFSLEGDFNMHKLVEIIFFHSKFLRIQNSISEQHFPVQMMRNRAENPIISVSDHDVFHSLWVGFSGIMRFIY